MESCGKILEESSLQQVKNLFRLVFLGTSASAPSVHRGLSSLMVLHDEYRFLIDCGEGTQRQIMQSGLGFKRLNHVLITHGHLDHILGLAGLVSTFSRWEAMDTLKIYAGRSALERIDDLLFGVVLRGKHTPMQIDLVEVQPGVIFEVEDFTVEAFSVNHRGPDCYGFLFAEKTRRPFLPEKAQVLGIPPGPWRRDLVNGSSAVLPDGRTIDPDEVLGEARAGTRLVIVGDAGQTANLLEFCKDADLLVIEATYLEDETGMAKDYAHLTARGAAELALQAGVKNLVLNHISRRYRERDVIAEARANFPGAIVARDFDAFQVKPGEVSRIDPKPDDDSDPDVD